MILGIGTDITEISRVKRACEKQAFCDRYYTKEEQDACGGRDASFAGNFAGKEAVAKALGTGFRGFEPRDVEILRETNGRPYVRLWGGAARQLQALGGEQILISIAHERAYATAYALVEGATR